MTRMFLSLAINLVLCGVTVAENLIVDPGLEAQNATAWTLTDAAFTTEGVVIGSVACKVTPGVTGAGISQTVTVTPETEYIALVWIRMNSWTDLSWFYVVRADGDTIKQAITHRGWLMYGIPFTAGQANVTVGWKMGPNFDGASCDMFALAEFENYIAEPSFEDEGAEITELGGWVYGAWDIAEGTRTGAFGWWSDPSGGGGWGFHPPFDAGDIIIAGVWIKTGDNDVYEPGFIDLATSSNIGWWALRTAEHVSEISIVYSDIEFYQYVVPYKVPPNGTSPEIMWWQSWGQSAGFCDDIFVIMSPYTNDEVPWDLFKADPDGNWGFWPNPEDAEWPFTPVADVATKPELPQTFSLAQNFPNPFNPATEIVYSLARNQNVQLTVYNLSGAQVAILANGQQSAGKHKVTFNATGLPSGLYLYRLQTDDGTLVKKMALVR